MSFSCIESPPVDYPIAAELGRPQPAQVERAGPEPETPRDAKGRGVADQAEAADAQEQGVRAELQVEEAGAEAGEGEDDQGGNSIDNKILPKILPNSRSKST